MQNQRRLSAGVSFASQLSFEGVRHRAGSLEIIRGVDLSAEPGELLCLLGPSGSGKTTLLRLAAGIERPTAGRIVIGGREVAGPAGFVPPEKRGVGLMFQDFALFPHLTILDNVRFGLTDLPAAAGRQAAGAALERVGLSHAAAHYPHALSGGEQQRVALARALTPRPSVILMDEPFSGLDSRLKDRVRSDTLQILKESRTTAIVVTHDAEEAMRMGDRIALLRGGRLVQVGTASDLYHRPADLFAAGFFSELNVMAGEVRGGRVETALGTVAASPRSDSKSVTVAIRLTGLTVSHEAGEGIEARILDRRFLGGVDLLTLAVSGLDAPLRARLRAGTLPERARDVYVGVDPRDVIVFDVSADDD